jgi:bacteriocin biosynthesis cyclodehydratase domain-containing protein
MNNQSDHQVLRLLPVHVVETGGSIIVKRGRVEIKVSGARAKEAVLAVLTAAAGRGATAAEIVDSFAAPDRPVVSSFVQHLQRRRILVHANTEEPAPEFPESSLDIFYWHFGRCADQVNQRLNGRKFMIAGVNCISRQLVTALATSGVVNVAVVDEPLLRNLRLFNESGTLMADQWPSTVPPPLPCGEWANAFGAKPIDCLVATSDFGGQQMMGAWNKVCMDRRLHFLPVVLQDFIGYVGPLVVPCETACFECFRARRTACRGASESARAADHAAYTGQAVTGFHPSMASMLGDIAAVELTKFYSYALPLWQVGTLIEIDLLAPRIEAHKILKVPRCPVCSPLNTRSSVNPNKNLFGFNQVVNNDKTDAVAAPSL